MYFEIIGRITDIERIAVGLSIRELETLRKQFGPGRWRKLRVLPGSASPMVGYG
jgi:hypothetical protein